MSIFNWRKKKKSKKELINNDPKILFANLLFDIEPKFNDEHFENELLLLFKDFRCSKEVDVENARQYFFNDYMVEYEEGKIPAQCTIYKPDKKDFDLSKFKNSLKQVWHWDNAKETIVNCKYELLVNDLMTRGLDYKIRVELFQKFLVTIVKILKPKAIFFPTSENIVEPNVFISNIYSKIYLYGLLNFRMFKINEDEILFDSLGLYALGLPDFEIQYSNNNSNAILELINSYSYYIYEYGSVIEDGNTVEGIESGSKWICKYNSSLVEPIRNIIKIETK